MRCLMVPVLVLAAARLEAQVFDFEDGLVGWTRAGNAFNDQPVGVDSVSSGKLARITVGGDYWQDLVYPLGTHGRRFLATGVRHGDAATGVLISPVFTLPAGRTFFSLLAGGSGSITEQRVELQVRLTGAPAGAAREIEQWISSRPPVQLPDSIPRTDGEFLVIAAAGPGGGEHLRQVSVRLPEAVMGLPARVKVIDDSASGHINADYFRFTPEAPEPHRPPVWGYADYHTHPASHLAFGALKGIQTIWGDPGGRCV